MAEENRNSRLEAFSDGVFAFAITLLVIDLRIPSSEAMNSTGEFWLALRHMLPSISAMLLSFVIILITWVNHHNAMKLIKGSSGSIIYANGFLLLTVVFMPFPTSLLGDHVFTDHAAPAVVLFNSVTALQAIGWILISKAALKNDLGKDESSNLQLQKNMKFGYFAFGLYTLCATIAFWFPLAIAITTSIIWIFWLIFGIRIKSE